MSQSPTTIASLDEIAGAYDAFLCDVWGVIHNGRQTFPAACTALSRARLAGKPVILITNAPRLARDVEQSLDQMNVPREAWDGIVTSGDVTRTLVAEGPRRIFHIGTDADLSLYDGLDVELVEEQEASAAVCTGLFDDENESPDDYAHMLRRLRARDIPFVCANPDIKVERGSELVWCAGALARDYAQLGGRTLIAGKPHAPIYRAAVDAVEAVLGRNVDPSRILAIGDGVLTDVKGALANGHPVLFISGGVHAADYGTDPARLDAFLHGHGLHPDAVMTGLA